MSVKDIYQYKKQKEQPPMLYTDYDDQPESWLRQPSYTEQATLDRVSEGFSSVGTRSTPFLDTADLYTVISIPYDAEEGVIVVETAAVPVPPALALSLSFVAFLSGLSCLFRCRN